ncbi:hypothetical protein GCM10010206_17560 [Streptomyces cinerochromogenes]|nr:hypothetical protein GCM10010206_17560 [Streptomyces cinerochromogenes]
MPPVVRDLAVAGRVLLRGCFGDPVVQHVPGARGEGVNSSLVIPVPLSITLAYNVCGVHIETAM